MSLIKIVFIVVMLLMLVAQPYPGSPLAGWAWGVGLLGWIALLCLGIEVFGFR